MWWRTSTLWRMKDVADRSMHLVGEMTWEIPCLWFLVPCTPPHPHCAPITTLTNTSPPSLCTISSPLLTPFLHDCVPSHHPHCALLSRYSFLYEKMPMSSFHRLLLELQDTNCPTSLLAFLLHNYCYWLSCLLLKVTKPLTSSFVASFWPLSCLLNCWGTPVWISLQHWSVVHHDGRHKRGPRIHQVDCSFFSFLTALHLHWFVYQLCWGYDRQSSFPLLPASAYILHLTRLSFVSFFAHFELCTCMHHAILTVASSTVNLLHHQHYSCFFSVYS